MKKVINYNLFKRKREEKAISTRKIADLLGVSHNLVNSWEKQLVKSFKPEIEKKVMEILEIKKRRSLYTK